MVARLAINTIHSFQLLAKRFPLQELCSVYHDDWNKSFVEAASFHRNLHQFQPEEPDLLKTSRHHSYAPHDHDHQAADHFTNGIKLSMAFPMPETPMKRSFSLPAQPSKPSLSPDPTVEILYTLPSARIVAFTSSSTTRPSSSNGSPVAADQPGTLSWVSRFERTLAVGM
jgi:hypothetical protein